ncbi:hypothetical protein QFC21_000312 [Naganishia friedmannii]|uniref:Uncharacterized protein n=1 Tax=Naganishia friedmannii TaxID=89922 RepID=A0ACC2WBY9_9TREE|nr:hypothetical protein QFC21_000312 [Naganishia friedmannii]
MPTSGHFCKIKTADLPKLINAGNEDPEIWIAPPVSFSKLIASPSLRPSDNVNFEDDAVLWYAKLGSDVRLSLARKNALRQRFREANYDVDEKREWKKHELPLTERYQTASTTKPNTMGNDTVSPAHSAETHS